MKKAILVLISAFVAAVAVHAQTFPHGQELPQLTKPEASEWKNIGFQAIWGDIFTRYPATYSPAGIKTNSSLTLRGWRGERVQAQALVSTGRKVEWLEYVVSDLKGRKGTIPSSAIEAGFVRYVMVDELNKDGKSGCSRRPDSTSYRCTSLSTTSSSILRTFTTSVLRQKWGETKFYHIFNVINRRSLLDFS